MAFTEGNPIDVEGGDVGNDFVDFSILGIVGGDMVDSVEPACDTQPQPDPLCAPLPDPEPIPPVCYPGPGPGPN